jgi:subtilisin family serine protease
MRRILFAVFFACGALLAAPGPEVKIERTLLEKLTASEEATAPFFVVLGEKADVKRAHYIRNKAQRGRFVADALKAVAERSQAGVRGYLRGRRVDFTPFWAENKIYIPNGDYELARTLALRPEVAAIIAEEVFRLPPVQPNAENSINAIEWGVAKIRADQVWSQYGVTGAGIVVGGADTGVQFDHPALVRQYRGRLSGGGYDHSASWRDPTNTCAAAPCDNNGHGTHTAGTMAGETADLVNRIGVAPGSKWIACKGCATNSCSGSALVACAQWFLDPKGNGDASLQPDVVNNSWGGAGGNNWYQSYVDNWRAAGIFPAFSAGNSGPGCGTAGSPGDYPASFASGATGSTDVIASFSSRGPSAFGGVIKPDISAPGVGVRSAVPTNGYASYSGTSMATPHTAGLVALVWSAAPLYRGNISATETLIESTALALTTTESCGGVAGSTVPNNTYGYGRIDALAAVQRARNESPNQPPTATITAPAAGSYACGTAITFSATASDPEDGALTQIYWTDNGNPLAGPATSFTHTYSCATGTGNHNIAARVTDSRGLSDTDSITISIFNPSVPAAPANLKASVNRSTRVVTLTFTDNATNETQFVIEWSPRNRNQWASTAVNSPNGAGTGTVNLQHSPGTGFWDYRVRARNSSATSAPSNVSGVKVP